MIAKLFVIFLKIGVFSFGGGYAMIPVIQKEIEPYGWITPREFVEIVGIAGMTPGPIAVNSATFVGFKTYGVTGALFSSLGVMIPSFFIVIILSRYFYQFENHPLNKCIFKCIKPVVAALIATAVVTMSKAALFNSHLSGNLLHSLNVSNIVILILALIGIYKCKIHPIFVIIASAALGIVFGYIA